MPDPNVVRCWAIWRVSDRKPFWLSSTEAEAREAVSSFHPDRYYVAPCEVRERIEGYVPICSHCGSAMYPVSHTPVRELPAKPRKRAAKRGGGKRG